ncbi:MAG: hypothetical protein ACYCUM_05665 [Solirubrobacteraceae bacterium]
MKVRISAATAALAATLLLGVAGVASASAHEWEINGKAITANTAVTASGGPFTLSAPALKVKIVCAKEAATGQLELAGKDSASIEFTECEGKEEAAACKVAEPISVKANTQLEAVAGVLEDKFTPAVAGPFTEIELEGCAIANFYPVEGTVNGEVVNATEELNFREGAGQNLTLAGAPAVFFGKSIQKSAAGKITAK